MATMRLTKDFREFLLCANSADVEYLIIGGVAVGYYGYPRATVDLDVWVRVSEENADRIVTALRNFGFDVPTLDRSMFLRPDRVVRMGVEPACLELLTGVSGVEFEDAFKNRVFVDVDGLKLPIIGLDDLRRNKKASGRHQDLQDLEKLPKFVPAQVEPLNERFNKSETADILQWAWETFGARAAIGTSFQGAGLVMMHIAKENGFKFPVFTMDTGLLFPETVALHKRLEDFFGYTIERMEPDLTVQQQAEINGPELWKRDPDLCCTMRKVVPLRSKLSELDCWITGLRRQQSDTRSNIGIVEVYQFDEGKDIVKLNPMANWAREAVWKYLHDHKIPYNPLHDQGYKSIGCMPCTAKDMGGENERGGRWTGFNKVECGIHTFMAKKS
jgi:phosphoadenosine phosphosulfate reductase